jgi:hypothetical protein
LPDTPQRLKTPKALLKKRGFLLPDVSLLVDNA